MDVNLETLMNLKKKVHVILGSKDKSIPPDCGNNIKKKFPDVEVNNIPNAGHRSVIFRREKDFAQDLLQIWENAAADHHDLHEVHGEKYWFSEIITVILGKPQGY